MVDLLLHRAKKKSSSTKLHTLLAEVRQKSWQPKLAQFYLSFLFFFYLSFLMITLTSLICFLFISLLLLHLTVLPSAAGQPLSRTFAFSFFSSPSVLLTYPFGLILTSVYLDYSFSF